MERASVKPFRVSNKEYVQKNGQRQQPQQYEVFRRLHRRRRIHCRDIIFFCVTLVQGGREKNINMSDATLKRKTLAKYNNNSVGMAQFSLNGGHRNQGWVGQTNLSRSFPRTLMRDGAARGHGGRQGTFYQAPAVISSINYQENPQVIKSSVLDNTGMLEIKTQWSRRPPLTGSGSAWKQDSNHHLGIASDRTSKLGRCVAKTLQCDADPAAIPREKMCCTRVNGIPQLSGGGVITKSVTKDYGSATQVRPVAMTYGDYLLKVHGQYIDVQGTASVTNPCSMNASFF